MVTPINSLELGLPPGNFPLQTGTLGGRRVKPNHTTTVFHVQSEEINHQIGPPFIILKSVTFLPHFAVRETLSTKLLHDACKRYGWPIADPETEYNRACEFY